jgi:hypothetical protein
MIEIDIARHQEVHQDAVRIVIMTDTTLEEIIEIEIAIDQETGLEIVRVHEKTNTNEVEGNQTTMTIDPRAKPISVRKNLLGAIEIALKKTQMPTTIKPKSNRSKSKNKRDTIFVFF